MEDAAPRGSQSWLTVQWRNAGAVLVAAFFLGGIGIAILFLNLGSHPASWHLLALVPLAMAATSAGYAAYLFRVVAQGEERLQRMGGPWKVNRSLQGTTRRSIVTDFTPGASLSVAQALLSEPRMGLIHVGRGVFGGLRAVRPAETGLVMVDVFPLAIGIRARHREGRTVLTISVVPSSVYGWPLLTGWFAWSGAYTWIGDSQALAEDLTSTLAQSLKATVI